MHDLDPSSAPAERPPILTPGMKALALAYFNTSPDIYEVELQGVRLFREYGPYDAAYDALFEMGVDIPSKRFQELQNPLAEFIAANVPEFDAIMERRVAAAKQRASAI